MASNEDRPWADELSKIRATQSTEEAAQAQAASSARMGRRLVIAVVAALVLAALYFSGKSLPDDPCIEAKTARDIAARSTGEKRETAILYAAEQQLKCDQMGR